MNHRDNRRVPSSRILAILRLMQRWFAGAVRGQEKKVVPGIFHCLQLLFSMLFVKNLRFETHWKIVQHTVNVYLDISAYFSRYVNIGLITRRAASTARNGFGSLNGVNI